MKTKTIKSLKKEVLVIELPEGRLLMDFNSLNKLESNGFRKLGFINKITEDDVRDLVEISERYGCKNYNKKDEYSNSYFMSEKDSFNSAIEKELFWVNPVVDKLHCEDCYDDWNEAQEKTFDRNRTLIFIKN